HKEKKGQDGKIIEPFHLEIISCHKVGPSYAIVPDPATHCQRWVDEKTGTLDFGCKCPENSGLRGKDCSDANQCLFKKAREIKVSVKGRSFLYTIGKSKETSVV